MVVLNQKKWSLQEMARTMLLEYNTPKTFWVEAINTACYVQNRVFTHPMFIKTPFELWFKKIPKINYFKVFGSPCFILNTKDNLGKFDVKFN